MYKEIDLVPNEDGTWKIFFEYEASGYMEDADTLDQALEIIKWECRYV